MARLTPDADGKVASMNAYDKLLRDVVWACSAVVDLDAEDDPSIDAAIARLYDILKARWVH